MKTHLRLASIVIGTILTLGLAGCNKPAAEISSKAPPSADTNSFRQVTAQLEPGGDLYLYLSTEQLLEGLAAKIGKIRDVMGSLPKVSAEDREKINKVLDVVVSLVKDSGVEDVSGFGASALMTQPGLYHNKMLLHHYAGKGNGFLWTMFGQKPHALAGLDLLPDTAVLAYFGDTDVAMVWSVIQKEVGKAGLPEAEQALEKVPEMFEQATGLKWDQVLASLGGEYGMALMLDDARKIALPIPGQAMEIPEPSLMLVAKVKDDTIFNRLEKLMKQTGQEIVAVDKPNLKMRTVPLALPLPIQLRPTIASAEGYLFIANSDTVIQQALAVKSGQAKGLKSTAEFQRLSSGVPMEGNHFSFVSQRFGKTVLQVQQQAMHMMMAGGGQGADAWQSLMGTNTAGCGFCVSANTDEGWLSVGNGNRHPAQMILAATVVPVAVAAGVALPAIAKAKAAARKHAESSGGQ